MVSITITIALMHHIQIIMRLTALQTYLHTNPLKHTPTHPYAHTHTQYVKT